MTHLTREAQSQRSTRRAALRDHLVNGLFTPYTFLCLLLLLGGLALTLFDAKGLPLLLMAAVLVAIIRLLHTIRAALRVGNEFQRQNNALLRASIQAGGRADARRDEA